MDNDTEYMITLAKRFGMSALASDSENESDNHHKK